MPLELQPDNSKSEATNFDRKPSRKKKTDSQAALTPALRTGAQDLPAMVATVTGQDAPLGLKEPKRIALVGVHGMGEQLRYDTIQQYTSIIAEELETQKRLTQKKVICELATVNGTAYPRTVLEYMNPSGENCELHIFEAYWSPLTKGQVKMKDSIDFLYDAGRRGLAFAWATKREDRSRFAFDKWFAFPKEKWMVWLFGFMLAVVGSLAFLNTAFVGVSGYQLTHDDKFDAKNGLCKVAMAVVPFWICAIVLAIFFGIEASVFQPRRVKAAFVTWRKNPASRIDGPAPSKRYLWFLIYATLGSIILGAITIALSRSGPWSQTYFAFAWNLLGLKELVVSRPAVTAAIVLVILAGMAGALAFARHWLVWYVGDLVVYFSATRPTRFSGIRKMVEDSVHGVFRDIYAAKAVGSNDFVYSEVIVASHSLGTVVAYEALNELISEDVAVNSALNVAQRTRLFLTAGSPLDKYAYLFRYQQTATNPYREGVAQGTQPMITSYANRPREWVNIWSVQDPISGDLGFYDDPSEVESGNPKVIQNKEDPIAQIPFAAHGEYFENPLIRQQLMARI